MTIPAARKKGSKTEMISSIFRDDPLKTFTPKIISDDLDLDLKVVTTIVNRLYQNGMLERTGWGSYRLKLDILFAEHELSNIASDMVSLASKAFGDERMKGLLDEHGRDDPFREIVRTYRGIREVLGKEMALNMLRISANKRLGGKGSKLLMGSVMEVAGE